MKRTNITVAITALCLLILFAVYYQPWRPQEDTSALVIGFLFENDESTPATTNLILAMEEVARQYPEDVIILSQNNVLPAEAVDPLEEMINKGCTLIFTNSHSTQIAEVAVHYPEVTICQQSFNGSNELNASSNFHTFNAQLDQGYYLGGIAAALKLSSLPSTGTAPLIGFVGSYPDPEVLSAASSFLLGVRSLLPDAEMRLRFTKAYSSFSREKASAAALIEEGCQIIAQHSGTLGPAIACEEAAAGEHSAYHVGLHVSMIDSAPTTTLLSIRMDYTPYVLGVVRAVFDKKSIEKSVPGKVKGNDISAGIDQNWVELMELNRSIIADRTEEVLSQNIELMNKGRLTVLKGNYTGHSPENSSDTCTLSNGYLEYNDYSYPSYHYLLDGIMQISE